MIAIKGDNDKGGGLDLTRIKRSEHVLYFPESESNKTIR